MSTRILTRLFVRSHPSNTDRAKVSPTESFASRWYISPRTKLFNARGVRRNVAFNHPVRDNRSWFKKIFTARPTHQVSEKTFTTADLEERFRSEDVEENEVEAKNGVIIWTMDGLAAHEKGGKKPAAIKSKPAESMKKKKKTRLARLLKWMISRF